jgi:hypothetical protein
LTISPNPTTTAVDCAPATLAAGAEAKCTATVTDDGPVKSTPTGSVTFASPVPSGGFIPGRACTLSAKNSESASCELSYSQQVAGSPTIAAKYEGDAAHAPSEGWGGLTVSPNPTTTAVSCSPNPASTSQAVTCKATVTDTGSSPVTPTGLANFVSTGAGDFNAVACALAGTGVSAECTVNYSQTTAGSPKITASYFGDKNHTGGSGAFTLTVNAAAATGPTGVSGQTGSHSSTGTTLSAGLKEQVAAVTVGAAKIISGIAASVPVGCTGAAGTNCPITVQLKAVEKLAFGKLVAVESTAKITTKVVVIGTETTTLSAGQRKTVTVSLSRVGKQLLHRFHRLRPKLVVTEAGKTLSTRTVSFTAAR